MNLPITTENKCTIGTNFVYIIDLLKLIFEKRLANTELCIVILTDTYIVLIGRDQRSSSVGCIYFPTYTISWVFVI